MNLNTLLFMNMGIGELLVLLFVFVIPLAIWVWAVVDLLKSKFANSTEKLIWLVVVIFVPLLGAILYLFIGRHQKIKPQPNTI